MMKYKQDPNLSKALWLNGLFPLDYFILPTQFPKKGTRKVFFWIPEFSNKSPGVILVTAHQGKRHDSQTWKGELHQGNFTWPSSISFQEK